ncbi:MAG: nitrate/nitrite transporter NrtS [Myxococcales bacterium]
MLGLAGFGSLPHRRIVVGVRFIFRAPLLIIRDDLAFWDPTVKRASPKDDEMESDSQQHPATFLSVALRRTVMRRAAGYAVVVGAILVTINHGDTLLAGEFSRTLLMKIVLTTTVPYCVSTASSVGAIRSADR